jgi:hypothetical protein
MPDWLFSLFCVHLSLQEFGGDAGDARTTKVRRRDKSAFTTRKRGLNGLQSTHAINTVTGRL